MWVKGLVLVLTLILGYVGLKYLPLPVQIIAAAIVFHRLTDPKWLVGTHSTRYLYHHHLYHKERRVGKAKVKA